jgi:seryl-tRNA synthetase
MLDIKFIRENPELVQKNAANKKVQVNIAELLDLDNHLRSLKQTVADLNQKRNEAAKVKDIEAGKALKLELSEVESRLSEVEPKYVALLQSIPNIASDDTPVGLSEADNVVLRKNGEPTKFDFVPKAHWDLGVGLDIIDNERGSKVSGARFTYLKGGAALLEYALLQYGLSILTSREKLREIITKNNLSVKDTPFIPVVPPVMIKPDTFQRMARLEPREERYHIPSDDIYLVGSAEHTLGAIHMDETLAEEQLPLRYAGFSVSFRREAGSYGKDTKGILRMHQFDKLEVESFTTPEDGLAEQDFIVAIQEYLMSSLGIPYQVIAISTGDMGGPDYRQIDIESWMPGQDTYRETHTSDYNTDYQSRRLNTKVKRSTGKAELVHMNDATMFSMNRPIITILENYQQADGTVKIPEVLQPFMFGVKEIKPKK